MIPITKPYFTKDEAKAVEEVLKSGWVSQGPKVVEFEKLIAEYTHTNYAVATNSCTSGMHLTFLALGIGKGDEVIVPSFTFPATPNSVVYTGATPVFADIDPRTYNIDPTDIERKITKKTKAIMPVHQAGLAAAMPEIMKIAKKHKLFVVEDAACALGATINGRSVGTFGETGCFSFHPRKSITTGEGGMVVTNSKKIAEQIKVLRFHGASVSDRVRHESKVFIDEQYAELGYNYKMSDIHAAIGIVQFQKLQMILTKRRKLADRYTKYLSKIPYIVTPIEPEGYVHTYQAYLITLTEDSPVKRNDVINKLLAKDIATRIGVKASHLEPLYRDVVKNSNLKNTEKVAKNVITMPLYPQMTMREQDYVINTLNTILMK
jgi:perosamine synthetase